MLFGLRVSASLSLGVSGLRFLQVSALGFRRMALQVATCGFHRQVDIASLPASPDERAAPGIPSAPPYALATCVPQS